MTTLPPPDQGFIRRTGRCGCGTGSPGGGTSRQHRVVDADGIATRRRRERPHRDNRNHLEERGVPEQEHDGDDEAGHGEHCARDPGDASPGQRDPRAGQAHQRRDPRRDELPGVVDERQQDQHRDRYVGEQRDHRGNLTTAHISHRRPFRTRSLLANQPGIAGR